MDKSTGRLQDQALKRAIIKILLSLLLLVAVTCFGGQPDDDPEGTWRQVAADHLDRFEHEMRGDAIAAQSFAQAAYASGVLNGWEHDATDDLLEALYERQNPDDGYGLGRINDAYNNGMVNPEDTTYLITTAFHVGIPLLDGYGAGAVPPEKVQELVDLLATVPLRDDCVPYSLHLNDANEPCVYNVNAGVGWFLTLARNSGFQHDRLSRQVAQITSHVAGTYMADEHNWLYRDGRDDLSDPGHTHVKLAAVRLLAPPVWQHSAPAFFRVDPQDVEQQDVIGYVRAIPHGMCSNADAWTERAAGLVGEDDLSDRQVASWAASAARIHDECDAD